MNFVNILCLQNIIQLQYLTDLLCLQTPEISPFGFN